MGDPWYKDGLNFKCTQCGACCTGEPGYVWLNQHEITDLAEHLEFSEKKFTKKHVRQVGTAFSLVEKANGDCTFYDRDKKGCTVYPVRPRQCRTWPFWDSNLESPEAWDEMCEGCPGAGKGKKYKMAEIVELATEIRI